MAKYDFIFSLDADEAVSPELKDSILEIKNNRSLPSTAFAGLQIIVANGFGTAVGILILRFVFSIAGFQNGKI